MPPRSPSASPSRGPSNRVERTGGRDGGQLVRAHPAKRSVRSACAPRVPRRRPEHCCTAGQSYGRRASRPVGRVLCTRLRGPAAIHLGLPLPAASCGLPASSGGPPSSTRAAGRSQPFDLAPGGVYLAAWVTPGAGGLLHHRFTLTPGPARRPEPGAVCFLWHCPAGHPGSALPTTLPCGARTFLTGLPRRDRPAGSPAVFLSVRADSPIPRRKMRGVA